MRFFLLLFFVFSFVAGETLRIDIAKSVSIRLNDVAVAGIFLFWLIGHIKKRKHLPKHFFHIFLFFSVGIISLLFNSYRFQMYDLFVSSLYGLRWLVYAGTYLFISGMSTAIKDQTKKAMIIAGALIVFLGYVQYFFYPSLRNLYYLGWDEHLYRMFSSFLDPNFAGTFFVLYTLFLIPFLFKAVQNRRWFSSCLFLVLLFLSVGALFLTYSRSALIMFLVSGIIFILLVGRRKYLLYLLLCTVLAVLLLPKSFQTEGTNVFRIASSEARLESAKNALVIIQENPILGVGFDAYRYAARQHGFYRSTVWEESHAGAGTDNSFLFILATTGIVGFVVFFWMIVNFLKPLFHHVKIEKDKSLLVAVVIVSVIGVAVNSFFINSLFYVFVMEWIWLLFALTERT